MTLYMVEISLKWGVARQPDGRTRAFPTDYRLVHTLAFSDRHEATDHMNAQAWLWNAVGARLRPMTLDEVIEVCCGA